MHLRVDKANGIQTPELPTTGNRGKNGVAQQTGILK